MILTANNQANQTVEIDPTRSFTNLTLNQKDWLETLGLVPQIIFNPDHSKLNLWDAINAGYQHGGGIRSFDGAKMDVNLSYTYPDDPPLKPIARYIRGKETAYQYQYGLMMIERDGKFVATRMD